MLEALARVEAFDAFELLAARYDTIALPWRELPRAARRASTCAAASSRAPPTSGSPSARATAPTPPRWSASPRSRGRAGMDEDAVVFAEGARELEPGHDGAARLLEHLGAAA